MFNGMKSLTLLEKSILLAYMIDCTQNGPRPKAVSFNSIYSDIDYRIYRQEEYNAAFARLIKSGIFNKLKTDSYIMDRDIFLYLLNDLKWRIKFRKLRKILKSIWVYVWKHFLVTIITSTVVAIITSLITIRLISGN